MILQHIVNPSSPRIELLCTNPGYQSPESWAKLSKEDKECNLAVWGQDHAKPLLSYEVYSLSYCSVTLERIPKPAPELLWDCINYIAACSILDYSKEEICWDCVDELDEIRDKQGHEPAVEHLKKRKLYGHDVCQCSRAVLVKSGCKCGGI